MAAIEEGWKAQKDGKPRDDCPYKVSIWGIGQFWLIGWDRASNGLTKDGRPT